MSAYIKTNNGKWLLQTEMVDLDQTNVEESYSSHQDALAANPGILDFTTDNNTMTPTETQESEKLVYSSEVTLNLVGSTILHQHIEEQSQSHQHYIDARSAYFKGFKS